MKHTLQKMAPKFQSFLMGLMLVIATISCTETETTDSTNFTLFYSGMTDIGPSMSGVISSPTYKGNTPSNFVITKVTLKGEVYSGDCFSINESTGVISINSTKDTPVGLYKISISCVSGKSSYDFNDIVEVNFMKPVPDGITVEPAKLQVEYSDIIDANSQAVLPTAQVKTDGNHVSISKYEIAKSDYSHFFSISQSGEVSIVKGSKDIQPGIYSLSLKLTTGASSDEEGIFENALEVNVTSKPLDLKYEPNESKIEEETELSGNTTFESNAPSLKGSLEGLTYAIQSVEPATDKIKIDPKTGVLSVAPKHGFKDGEVYQVSVKVVNEFAKEGISFDNVFTLKVVEYIEPITGFGYANATQIESTKFTIVPNAEFKGDEVKFEFIELPQELQNQLKIDIKGIISANKGNSIPLGSHTIKVKATNPKNIDNPSIATFTLTISENVNMFTYIRYGNNLSLTPIENYANQFRITVDKGLNAGSALKALNVGIPQTNIKQGVPTVWSIKNGNNCDGVTIDNNGKLSFENANWPVNKDGSPINASGFFFVTAVTGSEIDTQVTLTVPVFIHYDLKTNNVLVHYNPFVLQVNPKTGTNSSVPVISGPADFDKSKFTLDYRRSFNYTKIGGTLVSGAPDKVDSFLQSLWDKYKEDSGRSSNYGARYPMSYYGNVEKGINTLDKALAYVDKDNNLVVKINPNKWVQNGEYANGIVSGQMTFDLTGKDPASGSQIFPLMIWFDEKF